MKSAASRSEARDKLIKTAVELFYRQGYKATGINQIIAEAGVAKNTFYYYFRSKDDLCVTYLQEMDRLWKGLLKDKINSYKTPYERWLAPFEFTKEWNLKNDFRGCPFINMLSEITDPEIDIRKQVVYHKDGLRGIIVELLEELKDSDDKYSNINVSSVTDAYYLNFEGAIVACQIYREVWPFEVARQNVERLLI